MPQPQDITGQLGNLTKAGKLPQNGPPRFTSRTIRADERRMGFDLGGWFFWTCVLAALALQTTLLGQLFFIESP